MNVWVHDCNFCSYCIEFNNKISSLTVYRIGALDNISYEINKNEITKLPKLLHTQRMYSSTIYCEKYGLLAIGGLGMASVEVLSNVNKININGGL